MLNKSRVCDYCDATKTPQWRTGPLNYKTLCNSCGVKWRRGIILNYKGCVHHLYKKTLDKKTKRFSDLLNKLNSSKTDKFVTALLKTQEGKNEMSVLDISLKTWNILENIASS
jgi:hypothetical protein